MNHGKENRMLLRAHQRDRQRSLSQDSFARLQGHIAALPRELQDEILIQLLRLYLQPGAIILGPWGKLVRSSNVVDYYRYCRHENLLPDVSIMLGLSKKWLEHAKGILYCNNLWIITDGHFDGMTPAFFKRWHPEDLRLLPLVLLSLNRKCWRADNPDASVAPVSIRMRGEHGIHCPCSSCYVYDIWAYRPVKLADIKANSWASCTVSETPSPWIWPRFSTENDPWLLELLRFLNKKSNSWSG